MFNKKFALLLATFFMPYSVFAAMPTASSGVRSSLMNKSETIAAERSLTASVTTSATSTAAPATAPGAIPATSMSSNQPAKNIEISAAIGFNWMYTNNTSLVRSPSETDSVQVGPTWSNGMSALYKHKYNGTLWKIGLGYHFFPARFNKSNFLNDILVELNLYRSSTTLKGNVWQYQLPQFNNYSFSAPITSYRLMLDAKPIWFLSSDFGLYPIVGVGASSNTISYTEFATSPSVSPNSALALKNQTNTHFAYDLGIGVRANITTRLVASLEYVYTNLGNISPSATSSNGAPVLSPPTFAVRNQGLLLGINWKVA